MSAGEYPNGNTRIGLHALHKILTSVPIVAQNNSAFGERALMNLANGENESSAFGAGALENTVSGENSAFGAYSGQNVQGTGNAGSGNWALRFLSNGNFNTAMGYKSMTGTNGNTAPPLPYGNASHNTSVGAYSLRQIYNGQHNTAVGYDAGRDVRDETSLTLLGAHTNVEIPHPPFPVLHHASVLGAEGTVAQDNTVVLGRHMFPGAPAIDFVGIGTNRPRAALDVNGGVVHRLRFQTYGSGANFFNATRDDYYMIFNITGGTATLVLPSAPFVVDGQTFIVVNDVNSSIALTLVGNTNPSTPSVAAGTSVRLVYYANTNTYYLF